MLRQNRIFLTIVLAVCAVLSRPSWATPTVKKLDSAVSNPVQSDAVTWNTTNRAPSVRLSGATTTSGGQSSVGTKAVNTTTTDSGDSVRLPGLHGNLVKGISSKLSSNQPQQSGGTGTSDLTQRVIDLEAKVNTKQEILESGNGIDIAGNTVSVVQDIMVLPDKMEEITQEISDLSDRVDDISLSGEYYTITQTQDYVQQMVNQANETVYDSGAQEYKHITIIDDFDEVDFMNKVN